MRQHVDNVVLLLELELEFGGDLLEEHLQRVNLVIDDRLALADRDGREDLEVLLVGHPLCEDVDKPLEGCLGDELRDRLVIVVKELGKRILN